MRGLKEVGKGQLRHLFEFGQRLGVDILPKHFYSNVPDITRLRRTKAWRKPLDMCGVAGADMDSQAAFLEDLFPPSLTAGLAALDIHNIAVKENGQGGGYGTIEADVLHAFIRRHRPERIVQIGCGVSTSIVLRAAKLADYKPVVECVEPFPPAFLSAAGQDGRIELLKTGAEECPREVLTGLAAGDLLFIDSTHTVKAGSEVNRIILDILPRLSPGVFVHFHDIFFPYDYQRTLLSETLFFWTESTLLHAFLTGNAHCKIALSLSMLHYGAPHRIASVIPYYDPQQNDEGLRAPGGKHFPSSAYLRTA